MILWLLCKITKLTCKSFRLISVSQAAVIHFDFCLVHILRTRCFHPQCISIQFTLSPSSRLYFWIALFHCHFSFFLRNRIAIALCCNFFFFSINIHLFLKWSSDMYKVNAVWSHTDIGYVPVVTTMYKALSWIHKHTFFSGAFFFTTVMTTGCIVKSLFADLINS